MQPPVKENNQTLLASSNQQGSCQRQSTDLEEIRAALWEQVHHKCCTRVSSSIGQVMAVNKRKGRLRALIRGWGVRWYEVEYVTIAHPLLCPTGGCDILEDP